MKATYLFKMAGAWSPLWNLSDKPFFEIKSKEPIQFLSFPDLQPYQKSFLKFLEDPSQLFFPKLSKKQMEIFNQPHHPDCIVYGSKHADSIVFSEYQENYTCNPNPDVISDVIDRAEELFGTDHIGFENKRIFINTALSGIPFVVLNKGNGNFEFRS